MVWAAICVLAMLLVTTAPRSARAQIAGMPPELAHVGVFEHLDDPLPLDTAFRDHTGKAVKLRDFYDGKRPVVLTFAYHSCPVLCSMVLNATAAGLKGIGWTVGKEFDVVTISIDPRDTPEQAAMKKTQYVNRYGRFGAANGWHFLTGPESAIKRLTSIAGFQYAYDIKMDQFAHGAVLLAVTPQGRVSRYLYGFTYQPRDLRLALVEASAGKIGTASDSILLLCYHYDPATGRYSRSAMNFVRAGGVATMLGLFGFIFIMIRKEHAR
jgi:protein SCO1/2